MRKLSLLFIVAAAVIVTGTGCLKDKGFEDQEYGGTQITEVKAVAFPQASSSPIVIGINSQTTSLTVDGPFITLEQDGVAATDVHVTLTLNNTLVADAGLTILPVSDFSVNSLDVTIAAGQKFSDAVKITLLNSSLLDPTESYGVGLTITAVDQGYQVASNMKDIVIAFNIKNKYDGEYRLRGFHNRPGLEAPYDEIVHMITSGPGSVSMFWPALGDYAHPLNGGVTYYGDFTSNFIFDSSDQLIAWDWQPYATTLPTAVGPATDSRFDPVTKTIYAQFYYNNNPAERGFTDTLTYIGPR
jgi:hypothetical protein